MSNDPLYAAFERELKGMNELIKGMSEDVKAMSRQLAQFEQKHLHQDEQSRENKAEIEKHDDIKYHVPVKPIQISTLICTAAENSGFDLWNADGTLISDAISSVSVLSDDTIRVTLNPEMYTDVVSQLAGGTVYFYAVAKSFMSQLLQILPNAPTIDFEQLKQLWIAQTTHHIAA